LLKTDQEIKVREEKKEMKHITNRLKYAKDFKCSKCKKKQAVAFWPIVDPDIEPMPWCRACLDKAKESVINSLSF